MVLEVRRGRSEPTRAGAAAGTASASVISAARSLPLRLAMGWCRATIFIYAGEKNYQLQGQTTLISRGKKQNTDRQARKKQKQRTKEGREGDKRTYCVDGCHRSEQAGALLLQKGCTELIVGAGELSLQRLALRRSGLWRASGLGAAGDAR